MKLTLYKFNKRPNSTAIPSGLTPSTVFSNCFMKSASSVINPVITMAKGLDPNGFNYAYIDEFKRYYFIDDIAYGLGVWEISLSIDVLASHRTPILASSQYVRRAQSSYDRNIIDSIYPLKASHTSETSTADTTITRESDHSTVLNYFGKQYNTGYFILSIISGNGSGVNYIAMDYASFNTFMQTLLSTVPGDMTDVSNGLAKQFYDPIRYINSCFWFPDYPNASAAGTLNIGGYNISCLFWNIVDPVETYSTTVDIPKHPDAAAYPYLQTEPYSVYNLIFEPFGTIPIDSTKIYGASQLTLKWTVDYGNGYGKLWIYNGSLLLDTIDTQMAVSIPVAQITTDVIGGISSVLGAAGGILGSAAKGDLVGAAGALFQGIGNYRDAMRPMLSSTGASGSFIIYTTGAPQLIGNFYYQVDRDPAHYGEPLCQYATLSTLSGFVLCDNASYDGDAVVGSEREMIESFLNSGIFVE